MQEIEVRIRVDEVSDNNYIQIKAAVKCVNVWGRSRGPAFIRMVLYSPEASLWNRFVQNKTAAKHSLMQRTVKILFDEDSERCVIEFMRPELKFLYEMVQYSPRSLRSGATLSKLRRRELGLRHEKKRPLTVSFFQGSPRVNHRQWWRRQEVKIETYSWAKAVLSHLQDEVSSRAANWHLILLTKLTWHSTTDYYAYQKAKNTLGRGRRERTLWLTTGCLVSQLMLASGDHLLGGGGDGEPQKATVMMIGKREGGGEGFWICKYITVCVKCKCKWARICKCKRSRDKKRPVWQSEA